MLTTFVNLTLAEFNARFPLTANVFRPTAHADDLFSACLFETFGEELAYIQLQHPRAIWTLIDNHEGDLFLNSGLRFVNRLGYLVSTRLAPPRTMFEVPLN